jgi:hypothetical protein
MCLIFDNFSSIDEAQKVAGIISQRFGCRTDVWADQGAMEALAFSPVQDRLVDWFPCTLSAPILLVERTDDEREDVIAAAVVELGGNYAGT